MNELFSEKELNRCGGKLTIEVRDDEQFVSARELHERLEIETKFKDWFPRICKYGFEENKDYWRGSSKMSAPSNQYINSKEQEIEVVDYLITIDMAKHICMLQRSEAGKKFRQYFIDVEKEYRKQNVRYLKMRAKSKQVRNDFTDELHDRGYTKKYEYIQTTTQMRKALDITNKKDDMTEAELEKVTMTEYAVHLTLTNEYGYREVNPKCVIVASDFQKFIQDHKKPLKAIEEK